MPSKCWCNNTQFLPYAKEYDRCGSCDTLVNRRDFTEAIYDIKNEDTDLYGLNYWQEHFLKLAKVPTLADLHDIYLTGRCLYWLQCLMTYALPPASVMEIGCGVGQMPYITKQAGYKQLGVELSPEVCTYARQTFDVDMHCGTFETVEGVFDAILLFDLLEHMIDPIEFLQKLAKKATPNTILLIQTPCYSPAYTYEQMKTDIPHFEWLMTADEHIWLFSREAVKAMLQQTGFSYMEFIPAFHGDDYDMFLVASQSPIKKPTSHNMMDALTGQPSGWLVRAMMKMKEAQLPVNDENIPSYHRLAHAVKHSRWIKLGRKLGLLKGLSV